MKKWLLIKNILCTSIKTGLHNPYSICDKLAKSDTLIITKTAEKKPFDAAHTYIAHIRDWLRTIPGEHQPSVFFLYGPHCAWSVLSRPWADVLLKIIHVHVQHKIWRLILALYVKIV